MSKVHERVALGYVEVDFRDLPHRLQQVYCHCGNYIPVRNPRHRWGPPMCKNCDSIVPWFFHKCVVCDEFFVQDFRHPKFCNFYPTCWIHTQDLEWRYCVTHKADPNEYEFYAIVVEPLGYNPKQFSEAELADVFDFD